jgi:predicted dehydrogenase
MAIENGGRREFLKTGAAALAATALPWTAKSYAAVPGANDRVRTGVIGFGDRMKGGDIPAFLANAKAMNFELVALSDIWKLKREEGCAYLEEKTGGKIAECRNNEELYARNDVDAVLIATADFQHARHGIEAVKAGRDAYVEKPTAHIMQDARDFRAAVHGSDRIIQVGTQRRSTPSYMAAAEYIKSGQFGDIVMVEMSWNVNQPGRWRRPDVVPLLKEEDTDWKRYCMGVIHDKFDARKYLEFRLFWPYSSGIPDQWLVHQIDTVHWFTGLPHPRSVVANGGFTNSAGGVKELYYSNGGMIDMDKQTVTPTGGLTKKFADEMHMQPNLLPSKSLGSGEKVATDADTKADPQTAANMRNWMECVRSRKQPNASIDAGYSHSIALCMNVAAIQTGLKVTFDEKTQQVMAGGKVYA